ncbi:hypothetical protein BCR44DRAFT_1455921, partial [Catenaria anguillulae PL171]
MFPWLRLRLLPLATRNSDDFVLFTLLSCSCPSPPATSCPLFFFYVAFMAVSRFNL